MNQQTESSLSICELEGPEDVDESMPDLPTPIPSWESTDISSRQVILLKAADILQVTMINFTLLDLQ